MRSNIGIVEIGCQSPLTWPTVRKIVRFLVRRYSRNRKKIIHITFCDRRFITSVNKRFFNKNRPTDVIVFDLKDTHDDFWGDMLICVPVIYANSRQFATTARDECALYIIHGFLHLLGYSDKGRKRAIMKKEEEKILALIKKKKII